MKIYQSISILFFLIFLFSFAVHGQELKTDPGTTPDSPFYFIDSLFETSSDDPENALEYKEEKIAEALVMARKGKNSHAKEALERAQKYAILLEKEVTPDMEAVILEHSNAVETALVGLQQEELQEVVKSSLEVEKRTKLSVQVAGKITELCRTLADIDPQQYEKICRTSENGPRWQKELDVQLTEQQKEKAQQVMEILKQCYLTSGVECRCQDITFTSLAEKCSIVAPLVAACKVEGNEEACTKLETLAQEQDLFESLPAHLRKAVSNSDQEFQRAQYKTHFPRECEKAGITTKEECMKVLFKSKAPQECAAAMNDGELEFTTMQEAHESCRKIMFQTNTPPHCLENGITNPQECAQSIFMMKAPQVCKDAGLTGEDPTDTRKCEEILKSQRQADFTPPAIGRNCNEISDTEEKLHCLQEFYRLAQQQGLPAQGMGPGGVAYSWPAPCQEANALTPEACKTIMMKLRESTELVPTSIPPFENPELVPPEGTAQEPTGESSDTTTTEEQSTSEESAGSTTESSSTETSGDSSSGESSDSSSGNGITGGFIGVDNPFLRYFFRWW